MSFLTAIKRSFAVKVYKCVLLVDIMIVMEGKQDQIVSSRFKSLASGLGYYLHQRNGIKKNVSFQVNV